MNMFRAIMIAATVLTVGGAGYLSYNGIGRESTDLDRSIRQGSGGNFVASTSIK